MTLQQLETLVLDLQRKFQDHRHTGTDSQQLTATAVQASDSVTTYVVTPSNVEDTAVETPIIEFTIPANTIADGDVVKVIFVSLFKWDDTDGVVTNTLTIKAKVGADSVTLHTSNESDDATEFAYFSEITFQRVGTELYINSNPNAETPFVSTVQGVLLKDGALNANNAQTFPNFDHTVDSNFSITIDFSETGTVYWRVQSAKAYKI